MRSALSIPMLQRPSPEAFMWAGGFLLMGVLWLLLIRGQLNLLIAVMIGGSLLLVCLQSKSTGILLTLTYLNIMGDLRRIVAVTIGEPAQDPLLLIPPLIVFFLAVPVLLRLRLKDRLSKAMLLLLVIMSLEIINPRQGGLSVGLAGALFYIAPVLWFWVGREFASPALIERLLYKVILPLALLAALMGFSQTFIGFLPYQQAWIVIASKTYLALHVGASVRAFGFSISGAEYATLLSIGAAGVAAALFSPRRAWAVLFPILATGMILASGRTYTLKLVFTLALLWIVRKGGPLNVASLVKLVACLAVALLGVFTVASHFAGPSGGSSGKTSAAQDAIAHEAGGLAHPLDQRYSTVGIHSQMFSNGMLQGFKYPIGHGLGATTMAATKFGDNDLIGSSEVDFSDMFIDLGLVGGLTYLYIIAATLRRAFAYTQVTYAAVGLPVLAILTSTVAAWLIGGQYATSAMVFFLIGGLVYEPAKRNMEVANPVPGF